MLSTESIKSNEHKTTKKTEKKYVVTHKEQTVVAEFSTYIKVRKRKKCKKKKTVAST